MSTMNRNLQVASGVNFVTDKRKAGDCMYKTNNIMSRDLVMASNDQIGLT